MVSLGQRYAGKPTDKMAILKEKLFVDRGPKCEECGLMTTRLELHHWLFHRMKGHPELDVEQNCGLVCLGCHKGIVNGYESRKRFWAKQIARGYNMQEWWENLDLKAKQRFES